MKGDVKLLLVLMAAAIGLSVAVSERPAVATARTRAAPDRRSEPPLPDGHGRHANTPTEIPARGWWQIAKRVVQQFSDHRIMTEAAGVTFYALLALFPALAAMISLYGLFADPSTISDQLNSLAGVLPGGGMQIISDQVHSLASNSGGALTFGVVFGVLTSLWSANQGIKSVFDALNIVYDEHEKRSYVLRTAISLAFTFGTLLFAILALAAVVALPVALNFVGLGDTANLLLQVLRWPLLLVVVALFLAFVYRYGPSRTKARWRWVSWGAGLAAIIWLLGSGAFSWYVANFGSYNKTYGSLGAVVGFMTWMWISAMVVLLGGEVDAEMEHQTAQDTTSGPRKPLGARGATKADTVAEVTA